MSECDEPIDDVEDARDELEDDDAERLNLESERGLPVDSDSVLGLKSSKDSRSGDPEGDPKLPEDSDIEGELSGAG